MLEYDGKVFWKTNSIVMVFDTMDWEKEMGEGGCHVELYEYGTE